MWLFGVVVASPAFDHDLRLTQRVEDLAIEQLVTQTRIDGGTAPAPRHRRAMVAVGFVSHTNAGAVPMQTRIIGLDNRLVFLSTHSI
jgi:hypothetical protein